MNVRNRLMVLPLVFFALLFVVPSASAHQCRDSKGQLLNIGELGCLTINGKSYMARCEKSGEELMWRRVAEGCPIA